MKVLTVQTNKPDDDDIPKEIRRKLYQPIAPWQIRLLQISPSPDIEAELSCELLTADLIPFEGVGLVQSAQIVPYEALSYSWGYPALTKAIICNSLILPVSETLYDALRHIRLRDKVRYLWTDACCINQDSLAEKARQVEMMLMIFQKAVKVLAWLGMSPSDAEENLLFKLIARCDEYDRIDEHVYALAKPPNNDRYHSDLYERTLARMRDAARHLLTSRAFFRRTWIRQEFFAARDMDVVCGKRAVSFARFASVLDQVLPELATARDRFAQDPDPESRAILCYSYLRDDYVASQLHQTRNFNDVWFNTMMRSSIYHATLAQDRIFAVLGIAAALTKQGSYGGKPGQEEMDITSNLPAIDYGKPVSWVFQDFVKNTINCSGTLACLSIFQNLSPNNSDLPSWAIDLRVDMPRYLIPQQMAPWGFDFKNRLQKQDYDRRDTLSLSGRRIAILGRSKDWAETHPQKLVGASSPKLDSCLSADETWFPDGKSANRDAQMAITLALLERHCAYGWKCFDQELEGIETPAVYDWDKLKNVEKHHYAFVSNSSRDGDILVHLNGANMPFVLRETNVKSHFRFLGPAILVVGVFRTHKKGRKAKAEPGSASPATATFEYSTAQIDDRNRDRFEEFVLV